jgi:hypothetical protein
MQETTTPQKIPPRKEYFAGLPVEGDYSKVSFSIQSNKKKYRMGEPVFIQATIRNDSNAKVSMCAGNAPVRYLNANKIEIVRYESEYVLAAMRLLKDDSNDAWRDSPVTDESIEHLRNKKEMVERTCYGRLQREGKENGIYAYTRFSSNAFFWLLPGETAELETNPLNVYYDLSRPGKYSITYYRRAVTWNQNIDPPLKSNTIEIEVESSIFHYDKLKEPGDFGDEEKGANNAHAE